MIKQILIMAVCVIITSELLNIQKHVLPEDNFIFVSNFCHLDIAD